jgi:hypothetical protein
MRYCRGGVASSSLVPRGRSPLLVGCLAENLGYQFANLMGR